jgi:hypothetical protein
MTARRHECDGPWALTEAEAIDLGTTIPRVSRALRAAGSERVYVLLFGEDIPIPHLHLGLFARHVSISEAAHGVMYARSQGVDVVALAEQFAAEVRAQL